MGNWTEQDLARVGPNRDHKPHKVWGMEVTRLPGDKLRGPNKTESAYGAYLQLLRGMEPDAERVTWYAFKPSRSGSARCWYTPTTGAVWDGTWSCTTAKEPRARYRAEDDAIVKARSVSAHFRCRSSLSGG